VDLNTLALRLRQSIGNPSASDVTDTTLHTMINDSYREIGDKFRFFKARKLCTFYTVASTSKYALPETSVELMRVYDVTNKQRMTMMSDAEAQTIREDETDSSTYDKPVYYTHYRDWIRLIPVPADVYKLEVYYRTVMTDLVDLTDVPILPEAWHSGILRLARYNYFEFVANDIPKAISAKNAYKDWLSDKPDEVAEELKHSDRGVIIPTLSEFAGIERLDFDHSP